MSLRGTAGSDGLARDRFGSWLGADLCDQAAVLAPLVRPDPNGDPPPGPEPQLGGTETCLAQLDGCLRAGLVAQTDAMSPGLEATVSRLLWTLTALYSTRRELLLVCTLLDSA